MVAFCNGKQCFPGLCVIDAEGDLRVGRGQLLPQRNAAHAGSLPAAEDGTLHPDRHRDIQRTARAAALQVFDAEPALRIERCGLGGFGRDGQGQLQRLFVAFQLSKAVLAKRRHKNPRRHHPASFLPEQLRRADGRKAGQDLCPGIRQRAGPGQGGRLVQGAE